MWLVGFVGRRSGFPQLSQQQDQYRALFRALGSYEPVWSDAWIFVGSLLATYGMAKGWVEFWLIWVAVDLVGVPLLFSAGYYASGLMYVFYGVFTLTGFFVWMRQRVRPPAAPVTVG